MSRIVNTSEPGTVRSQMRRTIAEILRHLMFKPRLDDESKDMAATVVYALRAIADSIEITVTAWEKRDYYLKADRFRLEWEWVGPAAKRLEDMIRSERWEKLPTELAALAPHFSDVRIAKMTRSSAIWQGAHARLLAE
ncbi:MAG: hypothetical protein GX557_14050 [Chloroflexi bacterium]|nr:hypothetical protein [Chloroflexota bacterium]